MGGCSHFSAEKRTRSTYVGPNCAQDIRNRAGCRYLKAAIGRESCKTEDMSSSVIILILGQFSECENLAAQRELNFRLELLFLCPVSPLCRHHKSQTYDLRDLTAANEQLNFQDAAVPRSMRLSK